MKWLMLILLFSPQLVIGQDECGDGNIYAVKWQTEGDRRFSNYMKIKKSPDYEGGLGAFETYLFDNLILSEEAKKLPFTVQFEFVVTCEGEIKKLKIHGTDPDKWTNLSKTIPQTEGKWTPARGKGKELDCIFFGKLFINGTSYK